uniref:Tetraspanin n=1 Tax=Myripristis murdjan TaxID=586833 RepID=A0A667YXZ0_9TELE
VCYFSTTDSAMILSIHSTLGGLTLLAMGIWVSVDGGSFLQTLGRFSSQAMQFVNVGFFCIAIGAVLVLLGLLGCCGAQKESKCLLLTFFSIILVIFIAEVAAGVVALAYSSFVSSLLSAPPGSCFLLLILCFTLKCCGFTNYTDFVGSEFAAESGGSLPPICCQLNSFPCSTEETCKMPKKNVLGCFDQILEIFKKHANIVGGIAAGIGVLEIAAMIVSMYLYCHLENRIS